jgi:hypothetical protein
MDPVYVTPLGSFAMFLGLSHLSGAFDCCRLRSFVLRKGVLLINVAVISMTCRVRAREGLMMALGDCCFHDVLSGRCFGYGGTVRSGRSARAFARGLVRRVLGRQLH